MSSGPIPEHPAYEVIQLLLAMGARLGQNFASRAAEFGLSAAEGKVLLALDPAVPPSMRALARKLGYDASNLTGIVDRLEDRDAARREADPADRRVKVITATPRGRLLADRFAARLRADAGPLGALTESELRELAALLRRALTDDPSAQWSADGNSSR